MKLKILLLIFVMAVGFTTAQQYPLVTIQDIQYVPDSLQGSDPPSPLSGQIVRMRGLVMVRPVIDPDTSRGVVISAGARWSIYVQDPQGGLWGGMNVIQHDTIGAAQQTFMDLVDTAQIVEFTGLVEEYFTSTQLALVTAPQPIPVQLIGSEPKRPEPIELTLADFFTSTGGYNFNAEKYEGMYVVVRNLITSDRVTGTGSSSGNFKINDGLGNFAFVYNQSRYFKSNASGIVGFQPPLDGSIIEYVRGIVTTRADGYYIVPLYPGDVGPTTSSPPVISNIRRNITLVGSNQPVEVSATIRDLDGSVTEAKLFYRVNGGNTTITNMSVSPNDTTLYLATIPGVPDSALVDFYVQSKDNENNISYGPADTTRGRYFYLVLNRPITIQDVQYSPFGSGFSAYNNYRVQLNGIVTADTSDLPGYSSTPLRLYMQNGSGPWSGIQVGTIGALGTAVLNLKQGDNITVEGVIMESFNVTKVDSLSILTVNSSNNTLPAPVQVTTGTLGLGDSAPAKEQWESVLIKYTNITVDSANADGSANHGEILVNDGTGVTRVELQDGNHSYHNAWDTLLVSVPGLIQVKKGNTFTELRGILYFSFSNYKLVPRKDDDFIGYSSNINEDNSVIPEIYSLDQNYPNPFNPATTISYSIPKAGNVTLKIFNVLGQEVKTLANGFQQAGKYTVTFDASSLTSGVYFYSLSSENFNQVKKMLLLK